MEMGKPLEHDLLLIVGIVAFGGGRTSISLNIGLVVVVLASSSMSLNMPVKSIKGCFTMALILFSKINKSQETIIESF